VRQPIETTGDSLSAQTSATTTEILAPEARRFLGGDLSLAAAHGPTVVFRVLNGDVPRDEVTLPHPGDDPHTQGFLAALTACLDRPGQDTLFDLRDILAHCLDLGVDFDLLEAGIVGWMRSSRRDMSTADGGFCELRRVPQLVLADEMSTQDQWQRAEGWTHAMKLVINLLIGPPSGRSMVRRPADFVARRPMGLGDVRGSARG
jgi:hypothetical protein